MVAHVRRTNRTLILGPFAEVGMIFGTWAVLGFFESCIPQWSDPSIHCEHSVLFYLIFTCGITVLAGLIGWVICVIYHPVLPFSTTTSELPSALLFDLVIGVVSYGLIRWTLNSPNIAGPFFDWLGVALLVCGVLLILVNSFSRKRGEL